MRLITIEDFRDVYVKIHQRGRSFIVSKFSLNKDKRTKSAFNENSISSANWWIIPKIRSRWNKLITGSEEVTYEEFMSQNIFSHSVSLQLLSLGSGVCSHELLLAELNPGWDILCVDFSDVPLQSAKKIADERNLKNIRFAVGNVYDYPLPDNGFDVVFFNQSLHHFNDIKRFISELVLKKLKPTGKLVIHEYVGPNRLQYSSKQIDAITQCLQLIDRKYRKIFKTNLYKNRYYGSGWWRMIMSDPSECVDSENILPTIYQYFDVVYEKPFGGNLLMCALKDISHHFVQLDEDKAMNLQKMINFEDDYLLTNSSDFVFGVYQRK